MGGTSRADCKSPGKPSGSVRALLFPRADMELRDGGSPASTAFPCARPSAQSGCFHCWAGGSEAWSASSSIVWKGAASAPGLTPRYTLLPRMSTLGT
eukprot:CAMPEP_0185255836 /NCGR_PEP_ID=MMETSP1359-20130426/4903_1 /TAXON_ID=552665 /ORGANISM="Bigelowiella longifila, Strain CCMP242" /LENGTH=96 /DNA_ID=CAMNT_0027840021 /DNA_START=616 /DNA_END=907 /DNA_ORIENTATION=-